MVTLDKNIEKNLDIEDWLNISNRSLHRISYLQTQIHSTKVLSSHFSIEISFEVTDRKDLFYKFSVVVLSY